MPQSGVPPDANSDGCAIGPKNGAVRDAKHFRQDALACERISAHFRDVVRAQCREKGPGELAEEPRLLNDIGLRREQALSEASKLFWRP
jgi:hypothetical protein